ncbi:DUF4174 domain-containing protein [Roseovarius sp.]
MMQKIFAFLFMAVLAIPATAQQAEDTNGMFDPQIVFSSDEADLSEFLWIKRPLIVFADTPADPRYIQQMEYISQRLDDLDARDVIVLTDTDPSANSDLRRKFRPRGFMLVLTGKDGTIYLRKPFPWDVREISRTIDKLPTRQQEMRERGGGS